jgi:prefoldin subunit 5
MDYATLIEDLRQDKRRLEKTLERLEKELDRERKETEHYRKQARELRCNRCFSVSNFFLFLYPKYCL